MLGEGAAFSLQHQKRSTVEPGLSHVPLSELVNMAKSIDYANWSVLGHVNGEEESQTFVKWAPYGNEELYFKKGY